MNIIGYTCSIQHFKLKLNYYVYQYFIFRMYYSATRDRDYMTNPDYNGCDMTREIARFFADLAVYNSSIGRYDINSEFLTMRITKQTVEIRSIFVQTHLSCEYKRISKQNQKCLDDNKEHATDP